MIRTRGIALGLLAAVALVVSGCSPSDEPTRDATAPGSTADATDLTCESLISSSTVSDLEDAGWTSQSEPFRIGALELADGIQCTWGDFSIVDDQLMLFGWAPISDEDAATAQKDLIAEGWLSSEAAEGRYVTENPDTAISVDEDGFGMTYLFGDGWVTVADTKQDLLLIERPED